MLPGLPGSGVVPTPSLAHREVIGCHWSTDVHSPLFCFSISVYPFLICLKRVDNSLCSDYVWEYTPSYVPKQATVVGATHKDVVPREELYPIKTQV